MGRQDRLGVELDTPYGKLLVAKAHDLPLGRLGRDFKASGKGLPLNQQTMVTGCLKGAG